MNPSQSKSISEAISVGRINIALALWFQGKLGCKFYGAWKLLYPDDILPEVPEDTCQPCGNDFGFGTGLSEG